MRINLHKYNLDQKWAVWSALLALGICAVCVSCSEQDDAEAIRALVEKGAGLAEKHDIGGILELATQDLQAMPGDLDRQGVKGVLWRAFKYYGPLRVLHPCPNVEMNEDMNRASAQVPFLIVKREQSYPELEKLYDDALAWLEEVGENADLYRLRLQLVNHKGEWLVNRAFLERFTGLGFEG